MTLIIAIVLMGSESLLIIRQISLILFLDECFQWWSLVGVLLTNWELLLGLILRLSLHLLPIEMIKAYFDNQPRFIHCLN